MATLDELLALLPDNTVGAIDAADLRTIVTTLWQSGEEVSARVSALENAGLTPAVSFSGLWQINPTAGAVPGAMQVTSDTGVPATATWLRFAVVDQTGTDLTEVLLAATNLYGQQQSEASNWVRFDVTEAATLDEAAGYVQIPVASAGAGGTNAAAWQAVTVAMRVPVETDRDFPRREVR